MQFPRIPLWLPLILAIVGGSGVAWVGVRRVENAMEGSTRVRKSADVTLIDRVLTVAPVPAEVQSERSKKVISQAAISGLHKHTRVKIFEVESDGGLNLLADNRAETGDIVEHEAVLQAVELWHESPSNAEKGIVYKHNDQQHLLVASNFPLEPIEVNNQQSQTGLILSITDLEASVAAPRKILLESTLLFFAITIGGFAATVSVIFLPLFRVDRQITRGDSPSVQHWAPLEIERLAQSIRSAEAKQRQSSELANSVIDGIDNTLIFVKNPQGQYLLANEEFRVAAGCDPIGKTIHGRRSEPPRNAGKGSSARTYAKK